MIQIASLFIYFQLQAICSTNYKLSVLLFTIYLLLFNVLYYHILSSFQCILVCLLSTVYCLLSTVYCLLSTVYCPLSTVYCLLSTVYCLLSIVYCLLSTVYCHTLIVCPSIQLCLLTVTSLISVYDKQPDNGSNILPIARFFESFPGFELLENPELMTFR